MKLTLVIMAAGMGSRFGGGIKQLEPVGPNGEIIMDYSIHDAVAAGVKRVVFVIRRAIEEAFCERIGDRIEKTCAQLGVEVAYVFQENDDLPEGFTYPADRTKPWGTAHAVRSARHVVKDPFIVINADDYYGKDSFRKVCGFLAQHGQEKGSCCMAGFCMENTLSEHGSVSRGVCTRDAEHHLVDVVETHNLHREGDVICADGKTYAGDAIVSMNMWGLSADMLGHLDSGFTAFLENMGDNSLKAEYQLPTVINEKMHEGLATVTVLETSARWYGMTYKEDVPMVKAAFERMYEQGEYQPALFVDIK